MNTILKYYIETLSPYLDGKLPMELAMEQGLSVLRSLWFQIQE